jgi:hypothetical protein
MDHSRREVFQDIVTEDGSERTEKPIQFLTPPEQRDILTRFPDQPGNEVSSIEKAGMEDPSSGLK